MIKYESKNSKEANLNLIIFFQSNYILKKIYVFKLNYNK